MKKFMLTLAIAGMSLGAFAGGEEVNPKVLNAFKSDFNSVSQVEWTIGENYYRATFTYNDRHVFAYYDLNGVLMSLTRYVASAELPLLLQNDLKKNYADYWISEIVEVANSDGTSYYATLENADSRLVVKAGSSTAWTHYKKTRKL